MSFRRKKLGQYKTYRERDAYIRENRKAGKKLEELSQEFNLTIPRVAQICGETKPLSKIPRKKRAVNPIYSTICPRCNKIKSKGAVLCGQCRKETKNGQILQVGSSLSSGEDSKRSEGEENILPTA